MQKRFLIMALVWALSILIAGCATSGAADCPEVDCPAAPECSEAEACPDGAEVLPEIIAAWSGSGHAASNAEAFRHWDEDDPAVVEVACGKCHSTEGYA